MRIAFCSCICTRLFSNQPVWDWIAAQHPDHLVLLGDSLYLDVYDGTLHPRDMLEDEFGRHIHGLYTELIGQPGFRSLVQGLPAGRVWSIWDDHDFLWNGMLGAEANADPSQKPKVRLATAFQEAFRASLAQGLAAGSFPAVYNDQAFWNPSQPALSTPSIQLEPGLWLHLSDNRSWRTRTWLIEHSKRTMLGSAQRARLEAAVTAAPDAVHLFASSSTAAAYKQDYPIDWAWLLGLASGQRMLMLTGDIHRNDADAFHTGGWPLHEVTSSGVAVRDGVVVGPRLNNFGLVDVGAEFVSTSLYSDNQLDQALGRKLSRATWRPVD